MSFRSIFLVSHGALESVGNPQRGTTFTWMDARNRSIPDWFDRIRTGQVLLPRFQRHLAWSHGEVGSLLEAVLRSLPAGAVLVLEVGNEQPFVSRKMVGAPDPTERCTEQLLDGQQRLTALWRSLTDDYEDRTWLIGKELDEETGDAENHGRWSVALLEKRGTASKVGR